MSNASRVILPSITFLLTIIGWLIGGDFGAAVGLAVAAALLWVPWWRQPLWVWLRCYLRRAEALTPTDPVTAANDLSSGGVRYQDGVAVAALQICGKPHRPTLFTGGSTTYTDNVLSPSHLTAMMCQSMGLRIDSLSLIVFGFRRRSTGDYARVYDTLIGATPYAGTRETWLVIRIPILANADALRLRTTAGAATLAAAQRIASRLRGEGIRVRVATATDILDLEKRLGSTALQPHNRRWHSMRGDSGWLTTYAYRPEHINEDVLAQAWSIPADGIIQNLTLFSDGEASAAVTVRTPQPPTAPPSVALQTLPGEQRTALAANFCLPYTQPRGLRRGALRASLFVPVGPSGVLLGKGVGGQRFLLPLGDPQEFSRVVIAAEDHIAKRIIIRAAAAGERITVHSKAPARWESIRMPHVVVTDRPRPAPGTTLSVIDGSVSPVPRPGTVVEIVPPDSDLTPTAQVGIRQIGPATVEVSVAGQHHEVEFELFRAENRYVLNQSIDELVASMTAAE